MPPTNKRRFEGEWVKLENLISKAKVKRCGSANYPVLSMTMHDGIVEQVSRFKKTIASKDTSSYKIVEPGQLVVGFPIDEGVIYVQGHDFAGIMSPAYNVWDIDRSKIHPAYLELALHSTRSMAYYADKMRGTTARRRSITDGNLLALEIPLPTLQAQNEIVSNLHQVNEIAAASKRRMEVLDDIVKSRFTEIFGDPFRNPLRWPIGSVDMIADNLDSKRIPITQSDRQAGPYPYYGATGAVDFVSDYIFDEDLLLVSEDGANLLARTYPIAFSISGKTWVNNHAHVLRTASASSRIYLETLINMLDISEFVTGSAQPKLNQKKLNQIPIMITPAALQQEFAGFVARIDKLRFVCACLIRNFGTTHDKIP